MTNAASALRKAGLHDTIARQPVPRVPLSPAHTKLVQEALRDLMAGYPFLASLSSSDSVRYHAVLTDQFPVVATDGLGIYFNTNKGGFFDPRWTADHRVFAIAHEVLHVMREDILTGHVFETQGFVTVTRTPTCPDGRLPYKNEVLQKAYDAIINSTLIADNVGKPLPGIVTHPAITPKTSTADAYAIMWQEDQKGGGKGGKPGQPGQSPGQGDPLANDMRDPGSMGDPQNPGTDDGASQPRDPATAAKELRDSAPERRVAVDRAVNAARQAGHGTSNAEAMTAASRAPGVDWRSYMQGFLARAAGNSAWDFRRPSRLPLLRPLSGEQAYYAPSRGGHGCNHIVFVGDTSGSIQEPEHRAMLAALCEMMGDLNPRTLSVVWCDTAVQRIDIFNGTPGQDALVDFYNRTPIPRGGGTDFCPPFEMMDSVSAGGTMHLPGNMPAHEVGAILDAGKPDGLIYFTDLEGGAPDAKPDYPVLWVSTTPAAHPWGERVDVDPQELLS